MPRGGARPGAGRPKKPLADKILEGNPGKRELTKLKFKSDKNSNAEKSEKSKTPTYIDMVAKEGGDVLPQASEIFAALTDYIARAGCTEFVTNNLVEDFAFLRRAYLECEWMNRKMGRIANGRRSPYVNMALDYHKSMMQVYNQIWLIIKDNSEEKLESKNEFLELLKSKDF